MKIRLLIISFIVFLVAGNEAFAKNGPGGLLESKLFSAQFLNDNAVEYVVTGTVQVYNTRDHLQVKIAPTEEFKDWTIKKIDLYIGAAPVPTNPSGFPLLDLFPYRQVYTNPIPEYQLILPFEGVMKFQWGAPYEALRSQNISVHVEMVQRDLNGIEQAHRELWSFNPQFEKEDVLTETVTVGKNTVHERKVNIKINEPKGKALSLQTGVLNNMLIQHWGFFTYEMAHPRRAHFIDSPVSGIRYQGPTQEGLTDESGGFDYFPEERVKLWVGNVLLGEPLAGHKISPLDIFEVSDTDDPRVINMARFLQSLDADGDPKGGITIPQDVANCLNASTSNMILTSVDWSDDAQVSSVISGTIAQCANLENVTLIEVSADDAKEHLDNTLSAVMFRKDISRTPSLASTKAKLDGMTLWFPAMKANGDPATIEYSDEEGNPIRTATKAKPLVITYTDADPGTGAHDTWAAISRDDGATWKRKNLSRSGDRSSFDLANGEAYPGDVKKPVVQVKDNTILVAWSSKFCNGGKPAYAIDVCSENTVDSNGDGVADTCEICKTKDGVEVCENNYPYDDPYWKDDIFGIAGPQRSHDYTEDGFPEVGELPYSCVWIARGLVATAENVSNGLGEFEGDIVWFKPERLTSGRRDALQLFPGGAAGAGIALVWQEDPEGVRPGKSAGPGHGWSGATTSHKTDIWYSYITNEDFAKVDNNFIIGGDPEHDDPDFVGRPKALVPMSLPVRLSDNDVVNTDNLLVELKADGYPVEDADGKWIPLTNYDSSGDGDGTHRYGYEIEGLCEAFYEFINEQGEAKQVCITADNRLLDGDTGASRANLTLQPYTKSDGTTSAWAIINYEETKGVGTGAPDNAGEGEVGRDAYVVEEGKNVIYHSFDFKNPDIVSGGNIVNLPERDASNNLVYLQDENGNFILDYLGQKQLAYENSRRARFILQGKGAMGPSRTIMLIVYKEGQEGSGRPSDIMLRRGVVPSTDKANDNPYRFGNIICNETRVAENGQTVCVDGAQNISTVLPTVTTESQGDPQVDDPFGAVKVARWVQTVNELNDPSWLNPYEDARAHRGQMRGDFVTMGYSYTPNWAAARNGNDKYDFYIRRSFNGGNTWTTDPAGAGVTHCESFTDPLTKEQEKVCTTYPKGAFEQARNLSQLPNAKTTVLEPRIVATPGTIKDPVTGLATDYPEDIQNKNVYYVSYGTATNPKKDLLLEEEDEEEYSVPMDLYYSFSRNRGESYAEDTWVVNPDSDGNNAGEKVTRFGWLAKGDAEQGEAQLRMTPDGSRFYSCWLDEGVEASDIFFRRIMPIEFPNNIGTAPVITP